MNTGFFKSCESLERCVERLDRFQDITFGHLISDQAKPMRYKVKAVYLYASKSLKKYRTYQPARGSLTQVNKDFYVRQISRFRNSRNSTRNDCVLENTSCNEAQFEI